MKCILGYTKEILRMAREGGRLVPFIEIDTWPIGENVGMGMDIKILEKYLCKGINRRYYLQFDNVCQFRSAVSDVYSATYTTNASR